MNQLKSIPIIALYLPWKKSQRPLNPSLVVKNKTLAYKCISESPLNKSVSSFTSKCRGPTVCSTLRWIRFQRSCQEKLPLHNVLENSNFLKIKKALVQQFAWVAKSKSWNCKGANSVTNFYFTNFQVGLKSEKELVGLAIWLGRKTKSWLCKGTKTVKNSFNTPTSAYFLLFGNVSPFERNWGQKSKLAIANIITFL